MFCIMVFIRLSQVLTSIVLFCNYSPINCQALYIFDQIFGNAAIGLASINLSLRTMAVWSQSLYVVIPLVLIILGHWSLLLHGLLIKAAWIPGAGCQITNTSNKILAATFVYRYEKLVSCQWTSISRFCRK